MPLGLVEQEECLRALMGSINQINANYEDYDYVRDCVHDYGHVHDCVHDRVHDGDPCICASLNVNEYGGY